MKPNQTFELTVNDIEIIESALRAKAGRRGMKMLTGDGDMKKLKAEADEIMELLGRLHHQKNWFRSKSKTYVSG
tara:strand:- start:282 stop:503 length:222 start_codon:yes stop_codon:yes gene_type:complete